MSRFKITVFYNGTIFDDICLLCALAVFKTPDPSLVSPFRLWADELRWARKIQIVHKYDVLIGLTAAETALRVSLVLAESSTARSCVNTWSQNYRKAPAKGDKEV